MALETTFRHSPTEPVRGRELDANFDAFAAYIATIMAGTGVFSFPVYANNAAAITGGLVAGNLYRTGANPDPVCVVH